MEFRFYRAMHVMVKVILRKAALPPHMNGSVVFARWCNVQLPFKAVVPCQNKIILKIF